MWEAAYLNEDSASGTIRGVALEVLRLDRRSVAEDGVGERNLWEVG